MILDVITDPATKFMDIGEGEAFNFVAPPGCAYGGVFIRSKMKGVAEYCYGTRLNDGLIMRFDPTIEVTPLTLKVTNA
ncbi:MAG: hypothetical protein ACRCTP_17850 [Aeromonas popoffii]|uniref:hypothetical protein n=1 Tax=Aeromonas popoffii TaxID=70856 RepID=UPI003F3EF4CE